MVPCSSVCLLLCINPRSVQISPPTFQQPGHHPPPTTKLPAIALTLLLLTAFKMTSQRCFTARQISAKNPTHFNFNAVFYLKIFWFCVKFWSKRRFLFLVINSRKKFSSSDSNSFIYSFIFFNSLIFFHSLIVDFLPTPWPFPLSQKIYFL